MFEQRLRNDGVWEQRELNDQGTAQGDWSDVPNAGDVTAPIYVTDDDGMPDDAPVIGKVDHKWGDDGVDRVVDPFMPERDQDDIDAITAANTVTLDERKAAEKAARAGLAEGEKPLFELIGAQPIDLVADRKERKAAEALEAANVVEGSPTIRRIDKADSAHTADSDAARDADVTKDVPGQKTPEKPQPPEAKHDPGPRNAGNQEDASPRGDGKNVTKPVPADSPDDPAKTRGARAVGVSTGVKSTKS